MHVNHRIIKYQFYIKEYDIGLVGFSLSTKTKAYLYT
jgi:hypothetical protein